MNSSRLQHVSDESLQAYVDGEVSAEQQEWNRMHMETCWTCRTRFEETLSTIGEFVRLREQQMQRRFTSPPDWPDIRAALRENESRVSGQKESRIRSLLPRFRRIGFAVAVLAAAAAALTFMRHPRVEYEPKKQTQAPASEVKPQPTPARPRRLEQSAPAPVASVELRIAAALHGVGADMGDPVDWVTGAKGRYRVDLLGLTPQREAEIRASLAGIPQVEVRSLPTSTRDAATIPSDQPSPSSPIRDPTFEKELVSYTGGRRALEKLTNAALDLSDAVVIRAHALHDLELRFPPEKLRDLTNDEIRVLENIRQDHFRAVRQSTRELRALLLPVFEHLAIKATPAEELDFFHAAQECDLLVNSMLAGAPGPLSDRKIVERLRGCLDRIVETVP